MRALLVGVCISALDVWKLPQISSSMTWVPGFSNGEFLKRVSCESLRRGPGKGLLLGMLICTGVVDGGWHVPKFSKVARTCFPAWGWFQVAVQHYVPHVLYLRTM